MNIKDNVCTHLSELSREKIFLSSKGYPLKIKHIDALPSTSLYSLQKSKSRDLLQDVFSFKLKLQVLRLHSQTLRHDYKIICLCEMC